MSPSVSWRYDATTEPWLRALFLAGVATLYGAWALLAGAALALLGLTLYGGSTEMRLLVVLLALVGGPASVLYLLPMLRDPDQRPRFYPRSRARVLSTRAKATLGAFGGGLLGLAWWFDPRLSGALVGVGVLAGLTYALTSTRGRVDPATVTLRLREREFDLSAVTGHRARRLGPLALLTLSVPARPGRFGGVPTRFVVPARRLADVSAALDAVAAEADPDPGRDPNPQVRWVAGGLALLFAGIGVGAVALVGAGVGWYVASLSGLFAVVFLLVAREG